MLQVSPFGEWNKLNIYNCIVFTGLKPQNFIFLRVSAGGLVLTYSSARYSYKHLYKVYCYRKEKCNLNPRTMSDPHLTEILGCRSSRYKPACFLSKYFSTFSIHSSTPYVIALLFIPAFSCFEQLIFLCFTQFGGKFGDTALLNSDSNSLSSFSRLP